MERENERSWKREAKVEPSPLAKRRKEPPNSALDESNSNEIRYFEPRLVLAFFLVRENIVSVA
jgi:hypothetical protein